VNPQTKKKAQRANYKVIKSLKWNQAKNFIKCTDRESPKPE